MGRVDIGFGRRVVRTRCPGSARRRAADWTSSENRAELSDELAKDGIGATVLDVRSLCPLDRGALLEAASHTGKVLIVHEDNVTGGAGGELGALIAEHVFEDLDAPVRRLGALDCPIPYAGALEDHSLPNPTTIAAAAKELAAF